MSNKDIIYGSLHTGKDGEGEFSKSIPMHSFDKERELLNTNILICVPVVFYIHSLNLTFLIWKFKIKLR